MPRPFAKKEILSVNKPRNIFPQEKDFSLRTDCISFFIKAQSYAKGYKLSFQCRKTILNSSNLGLCIRFFVTLILYNITFSVLYEALIV